MILKRSTNRPLCLFLLGVSVLLPILLPAAILLPWLGRISELDARLVAGADQLQRYQRLVETLPRLQTELDQARNDDAFESFYFKAATEALVGAELQGRVQEIVNAASGRLISTQILPPDAQEIPRRIRVRTQVQGSTETLMEMLYRIEQARPFLFVERLSVRSAARPTDLVNPAQVRRHSAAGQGGELTLSMDLYGFVLEAGR